MDLARSSQSQSRRTSHGDPSTAPRPEDVQPANVLFREIHKNAWLKKLPSSEKRSGAFPKKGDRVWVVFCVHDDSEAFLELYSDQKVAVTHKPDWFVSLNNCLHVSPTICAQEEEYEFVITLSSDLIRLTAPSWELMMEWVETIRSKLQEMRILSPRENLYSKMPEARLPLAPTRDPNSPLPPPPAGPSTVVPGVEPVHSENSDGSSSSGSSVEVTNNSESPSSSSSSSPSSSSDDSSQPSQPTSYDNVNPQVRTSAATSLYITQSEPPVYTRPRQVLSRAASVPDSPSYSLALMTPPCPNSSEPSDNVTVIEVSSNHHVPHSALPLEHQEVFNFSFIEDALPSLQENRRSGPQDLWTPHGEEDAPDVYYTPPVTPARNADRQLQNPSVVLMSSASNDSNNRRVENGRTNLHSTHSSSLVDITNTSSNAHYECVFFPTRSPSVLTDQTSNSIVPLSSSSPATNSRAYHNEGNTPNSTSSSSSSIAVATTTVGALSSGSRNSGSAHSIGPMETSSAGLLLRRRRRSSSTSETTTTTATTRPVPAERNRGSLGSNTSVTGSSPRPETERRLQPAPHPYRQAGPGGGVEAVGTGRLTLREQQVLQLRREMMHPGGVRLQLRRKDCTNSIALVDAFGAVWVAGWKQREHPMLYNALHIGDQLLSTAGVLVQSASDAQKLIRGATSLYVEFVIRRVPCGRVYAIRRDTDGQNLGIVQEGNTAEIRDVLPNSPAARHGLVPRTQTCDGLSLTNWVLTEINGRPLNLFFKDNEVRDRLNAVGREISILVQPFDLVKQLKKQLKAIRGYKDYIVQ